MRVQLPEVASTIENELVDLGRPIGGWPASVNAADRELQNSPLLIGQLKALAEPFYRNLNAEVLGWLNTQLRLNRTESGGIYPWTTGVADDSNLSPASIGQLKAVFSLRFERIPREFRLSADRDRDGVPNWLEQMVGTNSNVPGDVDLTADSDGDGVPDVQEIQDGTNPNNSHDRDSFSDTYDWRLKGVVIGPEFPDSSEIVSNHFYYLEDYRLNYTPPGINYEVGFEYPGTIELQILADDVAAMPVIRVLTEHLEGTDFAYDIVLPHTERHFSFSHGEEGSKRFALISFPFFQKIPIFSDGNSEATFKAKLVSTVPRGVPTPGVEITSTSIIGNVLSISADVYDAFAEATSETGALVPSAYINLTSRSLSPGDLPGIYHIENADYQLRAGRTEITVRVENALGMSGYQTLTVEGDDANSYEIVEKQPKVPMNPTYLSYAGLSFGTYVWMNQMRLGFGNNLVKVWGETYDDQYGRYNQDFLPYSFEAHKPFLLIDRDHVPKPEALDLLPEDLAIFSTQLDEDLTIEVAVDEYLYPSVPPRSFDWECPQSGIELDWPQTSGSQGNVTMQMKARGLGDRPKVEVRSKIYNDTASMQSLSETFLDAYQEAYEQLGDDAEQFNLLTFPVTIPQDALSGLSVSFEGTQLPTPVFQSTFLLPVDLAVDADRDGEVEFGTDRPSSDEPYHFWINSDKDAGNNAAAEDEDPNDGSIAEDSANGTIDCLRDLEDFTQLALNAGAIAELINSNVIEVGFRFVDVQEGNPRIRIYHAAGQGFGDGEFDGTAYLEDEAVANEQMNHANGFWRADTGESPLNTLPKTFINGDTFPKIDAGNPIVHFIFEGISAGEGTLALVIKTEDGTESEFPLVPMRLSKVTDMYEHWTVGDTITINVSDIPDQPSKTTDSGAYTADSFEEDDCIVFVHGWRMLRWERRYFASTAYKRLWHKGFKGRFFHFSWPTEWTDRPSGFFRDRFGNRPEDPDNYADSEEKAYHSATGLRVLLTNLKSQYGANAVRMFSHSMGGVVASEALLQHSKISGGGTLLNTFAPCQAAMAAHAYDQTANERTPSAFNLSDEWDTPEVYASYQFTPAKQYFDGITRAGAIVNFHNHEDDALDGWIAGQDLKPNWNIIDEDYNYGVPVLGGPESFYHRPDFQGPRYLNLLNDVYEIYAHAANARSFALGAEDVDAFPAVDLNNGFSNAAANFSDTSEDHSAQFRATNMIRHEFWHALLEEFNLLPDTVE